MMLQEMLSDLQSRFPQVPLEIQQGAAGDPWLLVPPTHIIPVLQHVKNSGLNYLACLSAVDYSTSMAVVYQVRSLESRAELMIKVVLPRENAVVETAGTLYGNAGWFEREAYDLFGINFSGHPDLRRLMMPDDWEGHPLRKDYVQPKEYHGVSTERPDSHRVLDHLYPQKADAATESKE